MTDTAFQKPAAGSEPGGPAAASGPASRGSAEPAASPTAGRTARVRRAALSPARAMVVAMTGGIAALGLWFVVYAVLLSSLQESHTQHLLYGQLRSELAQATVPFGGSMTPGAPVAYLEVPGVGLNAVVVEGTSSADLANGPGHLPSTPLPGQAGNSRIYGRSTMFGAPFGSIHALRRGALITVTTGQGVFYFRVVDVRGPGNPGPSAAQLGPSSLTLVTSAGSGWVNGWTNDHVILADAALIAGKVPDSNGEIRLVGGSTAIQPAPPRRPTAVPAIDKPLAGDTGVLFPLVLWLEALVLVGAGLAWAYTRWTVWQVWVVGLPAVLALLWATTSAAMLLLPNLA